MGPRTHIEFRGPTTIYISKELQFASDVRESHSSSVSPEDVVYILAPDISATIGTRSSVYGTFCATDSEVKLMNDTSLTGAAYARTIKLGKYSTVIAAPALLP